VIDADSGTVVKEINRSFPAQSGDARDGSQIALGFVMKALKNQFEKNM
jgi:hypothetical protein